MGLGEIRLGEMGLGEMGLGEMGQNHWKGVWAAKGFALILL